MDVYTAIRTRRDIEAFAEACPPREVIERIIEAAVWAPNHRMTEPWRFHVVAGARREAMCDAVAAWLSANGGTEGAERSMRGKIMRAPLTIIVSQAASASAPGGAGSAGGGVGADGDATRELEDYAACAAAIQNLLLAAHEEGLIAHFSTDRMIAYDGTRAYLGLRPGDRVVAMVNVGYLREGVERKTGARSAPIVTWDWR